ncbi:ABC transporter substrate-binding protein [Bdellovibrio sp. SKB1291214]|uniref:substrate-binding periplasmic protein n=1 Tax=Bdellovibrio sp. SKB1291214 TaxID=1732569 RepID=UPI000B517E32|nr:ABC transporter substrate-binding protein [Bdellovibrio sp. SKB1291214]UYL10004.1 ABC transporter substrate-binding protein [Bdellovibrio sp. SKB1291214]
MKKLVWIFLFVMIAIASLLLKSTSVADDNSVVIQLRYQARPPFLELESGKLGGVCGSAATRVLEAAGIPFTLVENPPYRQLALLKTGDHYDCSVGWLRIPERENLYQYSLPICDDGAWLIVGRKGKVDKTIIDAKDVLRNQNLTIVNRKNYSFGKEVDAMIRRFKTNIIYIDNAEITPQMFEMIRTGRADYTFVSSWEFEYLLRRFKWAATDFVVIHPQDVTPSSPRHIICSKKVPSDVMMKINETISKMGPAAKTEFK